jgi:hypothetical protein
MPSLVSTFTAITILLAAPIFANAEPRVEMELMFEPGFSLTSAQPWLSVVEKAGAANVRIRQGRDGDRAEIHTTGAGATAVHRVTGVLTSDNRLLLPAGRFSLQDQARLADWISKLKAGGVEELTAPRVGFGLTEQEFAAFQRRLATPLAFSTIDQSAAECAKNLARGLGLPIVVDDASRAALNDDFRLSEEMLGMSQGTALAAMLRPSGLAFAPWREPGGKVSLKIALSKNLRESWPIGWPAEKTPREAMPDLFKFLNVEIADTPYPEAMTALQGRLKAPFLYDHNALARHRIDLAAVRVSVPAGRTYYKRILDQLFFQAKLKSELRVDDAGAPFLWITTIAK